MGNKFIKPALLALVVILAAGSAVFTVSCEFPPPTCDNQVSLPSATCGGGPGCGRAVCQPEDNREDTQQPPPGVKGSPPTPPGLTDGSQLPSDTQEGGGAGGRGGGGKR